MGLSIVEHTSFENRKAAGMELADTLSTKGYERPVVLALPRGGVPVGAEIAKVLNAPIDLLLVQKIGVPGHEELALAAVVDGPAPQRIVNEEIKHVCGISDEQLEQLEARELNEIERRRSLYMHARKSVSIKGCTAIVVDDGIATGATVKAALSAVRAQSPAAMVLAMGVAPPAVLGRLYSLVDEIVCLRQPEQFHSVGFHYQDFSQVSDQEVIDLLDEINGPVEQ